MSDFFHPGADPWRPEAWRTISACRNFDWLVLTKRPELVLERLPADWGEGYDNVWLGVTAGCTASLDRLDLLQQIPAKLKWVSVEPLLEPLDLRPHLPWLAWVVTGCESAAREKRRLMDIAWVRNLDEQCREFGVPHYFKQQYLNNQGRPSHEPLLDGRIVQDFPTTPGGQSVPAVVPARQTEARRVRGRSTSSPAQAIRSQRRIRVAASVGRTENIETGVIESTIMRATNMPNGFVFLSQQPQTTATEWLWKDRIPLGAITILEGDPGTNKSTLTYYLTTCLTTGRTIYRNPAPVDGGVVLLQGEDSPSRLRDSLRLRGADLARVCIVDRSSPASSSPTTLQEDGLGTLRAAAQAVNARLVVVDPVDEFFEQSLSNDDVARRAMTPLAAFAAASNVALVLVRHMTKTGSGGALYRGRGSIRLISVARSALLLARDPADENRRILAQTKSNLGPLAPSLSFELVDHRGCPIIRWLGTSSMSAEDLGQSAGPTFGPKVGEAMRAIVRVLANDSERVAVKVAKQLLIDAGISEKTIWRAKTSLGVVTHADGSGPKTKHHWCLPKDSKLVDQLRRELNLPDSPPSADNEEGKGEGQQAA